MLRFFFVNGLREVVPDAFRTRSNVPSSVALPGSADAEPSKLANGGEDIFPITARLHGDLSDHD